MRWVERQKRDINDLINKALKYHYLQIARTSSSQPISTEIYLTTDWTGRDFVKPLPFIEACARAYGFTASLVTSFIVGVGVTLFVILWNKVIEFFE